jgi:hypothetical protein
MFGHVSVGVRGVRALKRFYDPWSGRGMQGCRTIPVLGGQAVSRAVHHDPLTSPILAADRRRWARLALPRGRILGCYDEQSLCHDFQPYRL